MPSCVAVWPTAAGWLAVQAQAQGGRTLDNAVYVYADARLAACGSAPSAARPPPRYAAAHAGAGGGKRMRARCRPGRSRLVFALAMLGLWWRERR